MPIRMRDIIVQDATSCNNWGLLTLNVSEALLPEMGPGKARGAQFGKSK